MAWYENEVFDNFWALYSRSQLWLNKVDGDETKCDNICEVVGDEPNLSQEYLDFIAVTHQHRQQRGTINVNESICSCKLSNFR